MTVPEDLPKLLCLDMIYSLLKLLNFWDKERASQIPFNGIDMLFIAEFQIVFLWACFCHGAFGFSGELGPSFTLFTHAGHLNTLQFLWCMIAKCHYDDNFSLLVLRFGKIYCYLLVLNVIILFINYW